MVGDGLEADRRPGLVEVVQGSDRFGEGLLVGYLAAVIR